MPKRDSLTRAAHRPARGKQLVRVLRAPKGKYPSLDYADALYPSLLSDWMAQRQAAIDSDRSVYECVYDFIPIERHDQARQILDNFASLPNPTIPRDVIGLTAQGIRLIYQREKQRQEQQLKRAFREPLRFRDVPSDAERLAKRRAELIARTQAAEKSTEQFYADIAEVIASGVIEASEVTIVWIVTEDDLLDEKICEPLRDDTIDYGGTFDAGYHTVKGPPAHPNCRCALALRIEGVKSDPQLEDPPTIDEMEEDYGTYWDEISSEQVEQIDLYVAEGFQINRILRRGETAFDVDAVTYHLGEAAIPTKRDMLLLRGWDGGDEFKIGDVFTNPAFTSTTFKPNVANDFGNQIMRIRIPKGSPIVPAFTNPDSADYGEIILLPNSRFSVVRIEPALEVVLLP